MNHNIYLVLALIVIIITAVGVYVTNSSYKTVIYVNNLGGNALPNGDYKLVVKILVNYGPLGGGSKPLGSANIWLYYNGKYLNQTLTNSSGIAVFYVKPGNYTLLFTIFHIEKDVQVNGNTEVVLDYAYLKS